MESMTILNDYIEIPDDVSLRPEHITIVTWVYPEDLDSYFFDCILGKSSFDNGQGEQYYMFIRDKGFQMGFKRNSGCATGNGWNGALANTEDLTNRWSLLVSTWDGNRYKQYLDGELVMDINTLVAGSIDDCPGGELKIGRWWSGDQIYFKGKIDDVRIYCCALTEEQILELYHENGWGENQPPIADAGEDQTVECDGTDGTEVTLDGTGSFDPDGDDLIYSWTWDGGSATGSTPTVVIPSGTTTITLVVNDGTVDSEPDEIDITVEDDTPPEIIIGTELLTLWPVNHKYESIYLSEFDIEVIDGCDENVGFDDLLITSVSSDEEENGKGDGNTIDDMVLVDCQEVKLRKERSGNGNGRVYSINISVTDNSGNTATSTCFVTVPHNKKKDAIDDGVAYSIEGCVDNGTQKDFAADNEKKKVMSPNDLHLAQNHPNPFNPSTLINYHITKNGFVTLKVYDIIGKEVANLVSENKGPGSYSVIFDASNLPSGIYVYQLKVNSFIETKKMILMK
jgi:hypothetical protein